jgi:hypothetical protein
MKVLLGLWVGLLWATTWADAPTQWFRVSREAQILAALTRLNTLPSQRPVVQALVQQPVRIVFRDLRTIEPRYANYDALSWISPEGQRVILIHQRHSTAPPEALAALIAHEALHADADNSLAEETAGWQQEATVWQQLRPATLPPFPKKGPMSLVERLEHLRQDLAAGTLPQRVKANPGYRDLPPTSVGFDGSP